jgi:hypothetical protein
MSMSIHQPPDWSFTLFVNAFGGTSLRMTRLRVNPVLLLLAGDRFTQSTLELRRKTAASWFRTR